MGAHVRAPATALGLGKRPSGGKHGRGGRAPLGRPFALGLRGGPASGPGGEAPRAPPPRAGSVCVSFWKLSRPGSGVGTLGPPGADVGSWPWCSAVLRGRRLSSPPSAPALSILRFPLRPEGTREPRLWLFPVQASSVSLALACGLSSGQGGETIPGDVN